MGSVRKSRPEHLRVVKAEVDARDPGPVPDAANDAADRASAVLGQAVMHAAMSWVACCLEQPGERVEVARVAPGLFDAMVHFADGTVQMLRVRLDLSSGPVLRSEVSVLHVAQDG